jgi:K+-sensing histidine kinase KdpD
VTDAAAGPARSSAVPGLPRAGTGLTPERRWAGAALAATGLPGLTAALVGLRDTLALESVLLLYLLAVVLVAVIGGWPPALLAALASFVLANFFFTTPYHTLEVDSRDGVVALVVFVLVGVTVSLTVDVAARRRVAVARSRIEAEMLSRITSTPARDTSLIAILDQVRGTFGMTSVALVENRDGMEHVAAYVGPAPPERHQPPAISVDAGGGLRLVADGPRLFAEDRSVLRRLAATAARAWEGQQLAGQAAQAEHLAEVDRLRAGLLAAVGHELRTPLAGVKAAVSGLRQHDVTLAPDEQDELLATIEDSADRLDDIIANLLAMSRLQAGALSVTLQPVALDEIVARALLGLHPGGGPRSHDAGVTVDVPDDLPPLQADAGLLERVVANLVANACRYSPPDTPVTVHAAPDGNGHVVLRVTDTGPGVPGADWARMFTPFERLDDRATSDGAGLGLAIARGFSEAMNATLVPSHTPGGGLTMTLTLPTAAS